MWKTLARICLRPTCIPAPSDRLGAVSMPPAGGTMRLNPAHNPPLARGGRSRLRSLSSASAPNRGASPALVGAACSEAHHRFGLRDALSSGEHLRRRSELLPDGPLHRPGESGRGSEPSMQGLPAPVAERGLGIVLPPAPRARGVGGRLGWGGPVRPEGPRCQLLEPGPLELPPGRGKGCTHDGIIAETPALVEHVFGHRADAIPEAQEARGDGRNGPLADVT